MIEERMEKIKEFSESSELRNVSIEANFQMQNLSH